MLFMTRWLRMWKFCHKNSLFFSLKICILNESGFQENLWTILKLQLIFWLDFQKFLYTETDDIMVALVFAMLLGRYAQLIFFSGQRLFILQILIFRLNVLFILLFLFLNRLGSLWVTCDRCKYSYSVYFLR